MAKKSYPPLTIEWTHVSDAMPSQDQMWPVVLLVVEAGYVRQGCFVGGGFVDLTDKRMKPTHWAALPREA
jgi:hypothetical protein